MRDGPTPTGKERDRLARISPSDIADARRAAFTRADTIGRAMLAATESDEGADGPISDEA